MIQDLRYALRNLRRHPSLAAVAIFTLGLGIGGATAVFSVVDAVLLKPLPFHDPDKLVRIWELTRDGDRFSFSDANYLDLRAESRTLASIAAYRELGTTKVLTSGGDPQRILAVPIAASAVDVLGVRPVLGRMFNADEDRPRSAERRVVLGDALWRGRFQADPQIVGRDVTLDGQPFLVTGVMPSGFGFPGAAEAWIPLGADPQRDRDDKELAVIGRLAPGATLAQVRGEMRAIARRLSESQPASNAGWSAEAIPFTEWIVAAADQGRRVGAVRRRRIVIAAGVRERGQPARRAGSDATGRDPHSRRARRRTLAARAAAVHRVRAAGVAGDRRGPAHRIVGRGRGGRSGRRPRAAARRSADRRHGARDSPASPASRAAWCSDLPPPCTRRGSICVRRSTRVDATQPGAVASGTRSW